ncbi:uncharacterized protein FIBRA_07299 [Fibroporia radiculosa]|uniref:Uncharacterized protein n=1 Tax=Fibroporia radiculosa TaxID=599839 RepID=J4I0G2_9APHY|nr:uncharacterized protein FIBRA_07299 [Fibroporia radiculosa]CCM05092.1 predicted protein [Fibroporia radiculosa]
MHLLQKALQIKEFNQGLGETRRDTILGDPTTSRKVFAQSSQRSQPVDPEVDVGESEEESARKIKPRQAASEETFLVAVNFDSPPPTTQAHRSSSVLSTPILADTRPATLYVSRTYASRRRSTPSRSRPNTPGASVANFRSRPNTPSASVANSRSRPNTPSASVAGLRASAETPVTRKRGRPRKHSLPDSPFDPILTKKPRGQSTQRDSDVPKRTISQPRESSSVVRTAGSRGRVASSVPPPISSRTLPTGLPGIAATKQKLVPYINVPPLPPDYRSGGVPLLQQADISVLALHETAGELSIRGRRAAPADMAEHLQSHSANRPSNGLKGTYQAPSSLPTPPTVAASAPPVQVDLSISQHAVIPRPLPRTISIAQSTDRRAPAPLSSAVPQTTSASPRQGVSAGPSQSGDIGRRQSANMNLGQSTTIDPSQGEGVGSRQGASIASPQSVTTGFPTGASKSPPQNRSPRPRQNASSGPIQSASLGPSQDAVISPSQSTSTGPAQSAAPGPPLTLPPPVPQAPIASLLRPSFIYLSHAPPVSPVRQYQTAKLLHEALAARVSASLAARQPTRSTVSASSAHTRNTGALVRFQGGYSIVRGEDMGVTESILRDIAADVVSASGVAIELADRHRTTLQIMGITGTLRLPCRCAAADGQNPYMCGGLMTVTTMETSIPVGTIPQARMYGFRILIDVGHGGAMDFIQQNVAA